MKRLATIAVLVFLAACGGPDKPVLVVVLPVEPAPEICEWNPYLSAEDPNCVVPPDCEITLQWIAPTEYTDNSPLDPSEIQKFTLNRETIDDTAIINIEVEDPQAVTWQFLNMPAGLMVFKINVTDTRNRTSDWSESVTKRFDAECD